MMVHVARVRSRAITWDERRVVRNGVGSDAVELVLDAEWAACDAMQAVLANGNVTARVVPEGGRFTIPSSLMSTIGALRVCLVGYVGDAVRIVTEREALPLAVVESGEMGGGDPAEEEPDLWARLMATVEECRRSRVTEASAEALPPGSEPTARIEDRGDHAGLVLGIPAGSGGSVAAAVPRIDADGVLSWAWGGEGELPAPVRVVQPSASIGSGAPFAAAPEGSSYIDSEDYSLWAYVETE